MSRSPTTGGRPSSPASQSPNARKIDAYCRRVLADAARAAIRSASPNRFRCLHPRRRRRRDHRDVGELVGDRAVDELEPQDRLGGGEEELLLAHRLGLFAKPRISGHVKPRLRTSPPAAYARHALASETTPLVVALPLQRLGSSTDRRHEAPSEPRQVIAEDHGCGGGWLGFVKRSFRTRPISIGSRQPRSSSILAHGGSPAVGQSPFALACVGSVGALLHPPVVEQLLQMPCEGGVGDPVTGDGQTAKQRCVSYPPEVADPPELVQQGVLAGQLGARARWAGWWGFARCLVAGGSI